MYLISAYFDDKSGSILQRHIDQIAEKTGNQFMIENHVPPHLTLSAIEARSAEKLFPVLNHTLTQIQPGDVQFVSLGALFPYVLYAAPVLNQYLQELSRQLYEALRPLTEDSPALKENKVRINKYYMPMQWFPHVTLGKTLTEDQMHTAFRLMQRRFLTFGATVTAIGLARTNPHEDIALWKL